MDINFSTFLFYIPQALRIAIFMAIISYLVFFLLQKFEKPFSFIFSSIKKISLVLLYFGLKTLFYLANLFLIGVYKVTPFKPKSFIEAYENFMSNSLKSVNDAKTEKITWKLQFSKEHRIALTSFLAIAVFAILTWMPNSQPGKAIAFAETNLYKKVNVEVVERETAKQKLSDLYVYWFIDESIADANEIGSSRPSSVLLKLKSEYDGLNLRTSPSTSGEIVSVIDKEEKFYFLGNEDIDNRGITWYEVERENGHIGWVSSSIVEFIE